MPLIKAPRHKELEVSDLKWKCDVGCFDFESTDSLTPIEGIVGQDRAMKALKMGVNMKGPGYNIFITGLSGTGKLTTIKKVLEEILPHKPRLYDYAYVNNFKDPDHPTLLMFPAGKAKKFKKDLAQTIKILKDNIPQILDTEPFLSKRKKLMNEYGSAQQKVMVDFEKKLSKDHLTLGQIKVGEVARPEILAVIDNQPVIIQQLEEYVAQKKITQRQADKIVQKYTDYQDELQIIFKQSLQLTQEFQRKLGELETEAANDLVSYYIGQLKTKYRIKTVRRYLDCIAENILQNLEVFKGINPAQAKADDGVVIDYFKPYEINIILDNSRTKQCPVVVETSPTYSNIFGLIEKFTDTSGGWRADFTSIKAGSLLKANGGYLVLNAADAISETGVWRMLKRVLLHGKLEIQDLGNVFQLTQSILKPEPIFINTKIIFIGNNNVYSLLSSYEDDFNKIFKIKAEFDYEMKRTPESLIEYARVVKKLVATEKLLEFDKNAIGKIIEYGSRYAGEKNKLTTRFAYIADLVRESSYWAKNDKKKLVEANHVVQAYNAYRERHGLYESKMQEMITDNTILIETNGTKIGQINGLAVYESGNASFGKPSKITASVSLGTGNIINVEREAGLGGSTYNKGVLIISGYFREKFGKKIPLSFTSSLVFEQGYGMIDGDSASITEIAAMVSSISEIPIKQSFAITGSVNQKGEIQPIGGVNEKIEGFFNVCKAKGLTKRQGVIIPKQNVKDLMLKDEVIEAVNNKEFHIYPAEKVEDAIELLTGIKAGAQLKNGKYQANTVFGEVEKHLREMRKIIKPPAPKKTDNTKSKKKKTNKRK